MATLQVEEIGSGRNGANEQHRGDVPAGTYPKEGNDLRAIGLFIRRCLASGVYSLEVPGVVTFKAIPITTDKAKRIDSSGDEVPLYLANASE